MLELIVYCSAWYKKVTFRRNHTCEINKGVRRKNIQVPSHGKSILRSIWDCQKIPTIVVNIVSYRYFAKSVLKYYT